MTPSPSESRPPAPGVQTPLWQELAPPQTGVEPHVVPSGSRWQSAEQQSPGTSAPGSHCSPGSMLPSPHRRRLVELDAVDHPRRDLWRVEGVGRPPDEEWPDVDLSLAGALRG